MGSADWSIALSVMVFLVAAVFAMIYFLKYKKFSLVLFIAAIATFVSAIFYTWDVFELERNYVMLMLVASTGVMFYLGHYFSKVEYVPSKVHTSLKEKKK